MKKQKKKKADPFIDPATIPEEQDRALRRIAPKLSSAIRFHTDEDALAFYAIFGTRTPLVVPKQARYGPGGKLSRECIFAQVVVNPTRIMFTGRMRFLVGDRYEERHRGLLKEYRRLYRNGGNFLWEGQVIFTFDSKRSSEPAYIDREDFEKGYSRFDPALNKYHKRPATKPRSGYHRDGRLRMGDIKNNPK